MNDEGLTPKAAWWRNALLPWALLALLVVAALVIPLRVEPLVIGVSGVTAFLCS